MWMIRCIVALLVGGTINAVTAQTVPDAGSSIQEIERLPLQLPPEQSPGIQLPQAPNPEIKRTGPTIYVKSFEVSGNDAVAAEEILPLLANLTNQRIPLDALKTASGRVTLLYRTHGYPLAYAYVPPQDISQGIIRIKVLEGRYGEIKVNNTSTLREYAMAPVKNFKAGEIVEANALERNLLLLRDTPGVEVKATLEPGASVGTTNLILDVTPGKRIDGSIGIDNLGNRFTGQNRLSGSINLNNPLGLGDRLSLRGIASDEKQSYERVDYRVPVGQFGTQVGAAYSNMDYQLAKDFDNLNAHGSAQIMSLYVQQPLIRSRNLLVNMQAQFDHKRLSDQIDLFDTRSSKVIDTFTLSTSASNSDNWLGGGLNSAGLSWSYGTLDIGGAANRAYDEATAQSQGNFQKINASLARLQLLSERVSLLAQIQGQWSDGNLASAEKLNLGGFYDVSAYPEGEANGDLGFLAKVELRYALTPSWQLSSFVDYGQATINKNPWANEANDRELSGFGMGAGWNKGGWHVNAVSAWKLTSKAESDVDRNPRVWIQLIRDF